MAGRDRLAAMRERPQYEMTNVGGRGLGGEGDEMSNFYAEIQAIQDSLRTFNDNVARISDLQARALNNIDEAAMQRDAQQIDALATDTSSLGSTLRSRIKILERKGGTGRDADARRQQTGLVKSKFKEAIQSYQQVEQKHRTQQKNRMERQFKIVKPDATPEEIKAVVNDDSGGQIFSQALMSSNRHGESRAAYREVQARHEDIKRIEKTLTELAQLFNDMSVLVEEQDEVINVIETHAENVEHDTEAATLQVNKAVEIARGTRKKRWICFGIIIAILVIIAIIIAVAVAAKK